MFSTSASFYSSLIAIMISNFTLENLVLSTDTSINFPISFALKIVRSAGFPVPTEMAYRFTADTSAYTY